MMLKLHCSRKTTTFAFQHFYSWTCLYKGIIEDDQIKVAAFSLESFAYLTGLVIANNNASSNSARSHIANRQEAWLYLNQSACSNAITASVMIGCDQTNQISKRLKIKSSYFNLATFDNTLASISGPPRVLSAHNCNLSIFFSITSHVIENRTIDFNRIFWII